MKKYFFIIMLLCASVFSQARSITRCGYPFKIFAMTGAIMAAQTEIGIEEVALLTLTTFTQQGDGSWCFSMPVMNGINPLPNSEPTKKVMTMEKQDQPKEIKDIKSCVAEAYEKSGLTVKTSKYEHL